MTSVTAQCSIGAKVYWKSITACAPVVLDIAALREGLVALLVRHAGHLHDHRPGHLPQQQVPCEHGTWIHTKAKRQMAAHVAGQARTRLCGLARTRTEHAWGQVRGVAAQIPQSSEGMTHHSRAGGYGATQAEHAGPAGNGVRHIARPAVLAEGVPAPRGAHGAHVKLLEADLARLLQRMRTAPSVSANQAHVCIWCSGDMRISRLLWRRQTSCCYGTLICACRVQRQGGSPGMHAAIREVGSMVERAQPGRRWTSRSPLPKCPLCAARRPCR